MIFLTFWHQIQDEIHAHMLKSLIYLCPEPTYIRFNNAQTKTKHIHCNIIDTSQVNETTGHGNMYFVLDLPKNDHR